MTGPPVPFSSLPLSKAHEHTKLNAWGAYGDDDELGFLNRQTDETVAAAAKSEIKTGVRVNINAPMDFQNDRPLFNRQVFSKSVYQKHPRIVHDDTWTFNTQSSTQWDGLRHFGYQKARRFYNDVTLEDVACTTDRGKSNPNILGVHNMAHKGIVGRGILVDFEKWRHTDAARKFDEERTGGTLGQWHSFKTSYIKLEWLKEILRETGTEVRWADVLFVRSGFFKGYKELPPQVLADLVNVNPPGMGGVEQSDEVLKWVWENFSAVAGDQPGWEQWPTPYDWSMHEVFLAGWGMPIGELFDLDELSKECERQGRWSFFLTSEPTFVPGGVASPPNALAIF